MVILFLLESLLVPVSILLRCQEPFFKFPLSYRPIDYHQSHYLIILHFEESLGSIMGNFWCPGCHLTRVLGRLYLIW